MNRMKTLMLLATLTALLLWAGHALAGEGGLMMALVFAGLMNFGAYWWSDKIVLRMYRAQEVDEAQAPALHSLVRDLVQRADLPMPKSYLIPEANPNAFATGRNPHDERSHQGGGPGPAPCAVRAHTRAAVHPREPPGSASCSGSFSATARISPSWWTNTVASSAW